MRRVGRPTAGDEPGSLRFVWMRSPGLAAQDRREKRTAVPVAGQRNPGRRNAESGLVKLGKFPLLPDSGAAKGTLERMSENHPLASIQGMFALALWSVYSLYAAISYPDVLTSVLIGGFFGFVACLAVLFNFNYWRATVLLASSVYLLLYVIRIVRMTAIVTDLSFLSALSFYYSVSWRVTIGAFEEKGLLGGLTHAFLEYVMPVLVVALISVILISSREKRGVSRTG